MIDWDRVRILVEEVGAEDFDEVVELFLEEVEAVTDRLSQMTDRSTLGQDLHFLKGSAMSLGFAAFSDLCHAGESAAENGAAETIDVDQILKSFAMSKQVFLDDLPKQKAA